MSKINFPKDDVVVYVLHVNKPEYKERKKHIDEMLAKHEIPFEYILDGDIDSITDEVDRELFASPTPLRLSEKSCCYKHFIAWQKFLKTKSKYCLIFEDDVFLAEDFVYKFKISLDELQGYEDYEDLVHVVYSNANNRYVPSEKLKPGVCLYSGFVDISFGGTDAYLVTKKSAKQYLKKVQEGKFYISVDCQMRDMSKEIGVKVLRFERPIVEQGTQSGRFKSSIQPNKYPKWIVRLKWAIKKALRMRK